VLVKGPCAGLTVGAVIDIAAEVLSNVVPDVLADVSLFVPANIDACVSSINTNFLSGTTVGAFLALPGLSLQANANIKLPVISANVNAAITATLHDLLSADVNAHAALSLILAGIDLNVNAAVTLGNGAYNAWKLDLNAAANLNVALGVSALSLTSLPSSITGVVLDASIKLDLYALVNYVLNFHAKVHLAVDVQVAILKLLNPTLSIQAIIQLTGLTGCTPKIVAAIVADAQLNGIGFVPAPGQIVGVVAKVKVGTGIFANVLIEVAVPNLSIDISSNLCIAL